MIVADDSIIFKKFMDFTRKYEKVYSSMEEFVARFEIYKKNLLEVLETDDFTGDQVFGITKFSDLTQEEFANTYLTLDLSVPNGFCAARLQLLDGFEAPASLDWRSTGKVSPVKNQAACGSCWAFSTVGLLESRTLMNGGNATYSEQQLVDCDKGGVDSGCNGGLMHTALKYVSTKGLMSDKDYAYKGRGGLCAYNASKTLTKAGNITCQENLSVDATKNLLATAGPLAIALDATDFRRYTGNVLSCRTSRPNHAVLLVGYGADHWIIKNSWGTNWGEKGFVRVSNVAGKNCGVGAYIVNASLA